MGSAMPLTNGSIYQFQKRDTGAVPDTVAGMLCYPSTDRGTISAL
jgi:hypothetical protein